MSVFVVLLTLWTVTCAAPQYGYEQPIIGGPAGTYNGLPASGAAGHGGDKYLPPAATTVAPLIRKQFYVISAPDDSDNQPKNKHLVLGRPQRNYRVVFIKAPNSGAGNIKYSAEFAQNEEKTVIYVLNKKDDELDASDIATPAPTAASQPEVFFIKYRTDDEAQQAQKEIQAEYDKLGGTNEVADETTAPITSVIGSLEGLNTDGSYNYRQTNENSGNSKTPEVPSSQYLPSVFKHKTA
ncbi:uncharacterized protein LOC106082690 [Stomoxys calcitrans]|uniref:uncharacterized protein LOC106082690 n=1 Tax=Stomoxys calcitrans TaxID=35570 RepID=UPI0027E2E14A|nr:uncharacterized protein LOC106082690 [Stomoxys calcitrans]